jgi:hypothetical protein
VGRAVPLAAIGTRWAPAAPMTPIDESRGISPVARTVWLTKQRVQQAMRDVGIRGVVSVLDGWPVDGDAA